MDLGRVLVEPPGSVLLGMHRPRGGRSSLHSKGVVFTGPGGATFSIKGRTVNILRFTSHIWSLLQILLFMLCVCFVCY